MSWLICYDFGILVKKECVFACKCYDHMRRRLLIVWDRLGHKERAIDVIKVYMEVSDEMGRETMRYIRCVIACGIKCKN